MKIRTITTGFSLKYPLEEKEFKALAEFTNHSKEVFEKEGYEVQTIRTSTQPWEEYFESEGQIIALAKKLEELTKKYNLDFFSMGTTHESKNIPIIYNLLKNTSNCFCTVAVCDDREINYESARQTAKLMKKLAELEPEGFANFRLSALFNTKPGSPFYPMAYHKGKTSFAIGTENSDMICKAFSKAGNIEEAREILKEMLTEEYKKIESVAEKISKEEGIKYDGIDVSIAPSTSPDESIAYGFEKLGLGKFGEPGTLAIAKAVTTAIKNIDVKKCGYSGLMLPVLEDYGLTKRNEKKAFNISNILLYSAVCGTGLDTIPV
ncbi:MAG: DUF711 family protein, partial [Candidatus Aenigmarchaeota archaeon]|nr:DUF711 family protein [Candidatus Aenigmarchaeota archaeon]